MDDHRTLLKDVFGESSESEGDEPHHHQQQVQFLDLDNGGRSLSVSEINPSWERVTGINGLWLCRDFLSPKQQSFLLSSIENEGWFAEASHNQAMRFGDLPAWATKLSKSIREVVHFSELVDIAACDDDEDTYFFPSDLLWREPLFDQLIVNVYQPAEGITAHVDLMRFEDGIAILSLESSCVMQFSRVEDEVCDSGNTGKESKRDDSSLTKIAVYLTPGSLVLMWGEARYVWKHEINRKPGFQKWEGQDIEQHKRTSITLRKLCQIE